MDLIDWQSRPAVFGGGFVTDSVAFLPRMNLVRGILCSFPRRSSAVGPQLPPPPPRRTVQSSPAIMSLAMGTVRSVVATAGRQAGLRLFTPQGPGGGGRGLGSYVGESAAFKNKRGGSRPEGDKWNLRSPGWVGTIIIRQSFPSSAQLQFFCVQMCALSLPATFFL